jgi:hypothetical protein
MNCGENLFALNGTPSPRKKIIERRIVRSLSPSKRGQTVMIRLECGHLHSMGASRAPQRLMECWICRRELAPKLMEMESQSDDRTTE